MSDPVKLLKYLKENTADPDQRNALAMAIDAIQFKGYSSKMQAIKEEIKTLDPYNYEAYMKGLEDICNKHGVPIEQLEFLPTSLGKLLSAIAEGNVFVKGDHTSFLVDNSVLDYPIFVMEDDGMGYSTRSNYAFTKILDKDGKKLEIWT